MAARLTTRQANNVRDHIKASLLVKRVQDYALKTVDSDGNLLVPEMTPNEIRAAEVLLARALPTLSSTDSTIRSESGPAGMSDADLEAIIKNDPKVGKIGAK